MFNRGLVLRFLVQARNRTLNRFSSNSGLSLAVLLFAVLLMPSSGWASTTKNCPTEPTQNVPIVSGETYSGTNCVLKTTGDVDSFTFNASAGDTWSVVEGVGASPKSDVCLTLYAPGSTGTYFFRGCTNVGVGAASVATNQKLTTAGTYTIVVTELVSGATAYGLSLERISPSPSDATALTLSKNVTGSVNPPTAQDAYTFYGATTGTYAIVASYTSGATDVCFNVYQSGASVLTGNPPCTNIGVGAGTITEYVTPKVNGTFLVVVYTATNDGTANYNLEASCFLGVCPVPPPPCALKDAPSYDATTGTLTMNFTIATPVAAIWTTWLVSQGNVPLQLWSQSEPVTEPTVTVVKTQPSVAKSGVDGVLSTLTVAANATSPGGITCSSWALVNTK